jgi:alpha-1,2-mannosyltransferase
MEIVAWHPRRELTPGKVTRVSSVLERRDSTTPRNQRTKSRLLVIGGVSFAVALAGWLIYAFTHAAPYTVDPADLLLMALVIGDLAQPDGRRVKGTAVGIAAGIKLIPLVFIPYLLLTSRFRAAAVAAGTFAGTVVLGFLVVPHDSSDWWLHGLFFNGSRTGFIGWGGNQSLRAILTRLAGSIHGATAAWMVAALLAAVIGLASAVLLDRAGHAMLAILAIALVGLLDSPISWDHHWVRVVPGMMAAAHYGWRARQAGQRSAARWYTALACALLLIFAAWPGALWGVPATGAGDFTNGLIWADPNSRVTRYVLLGDRPGYLEYHWRGLQNLSGNAFILTGVALLVLLAVVAVRTRRDAAARPA